ncbi:hypothetical protein FHS91_003043 [Sphingobium xanthum]
MTVPSGAFLVPRRLLKNRVSKRLKPATGRAPRDRDARYAIDFMLRRDITRRPDLMPFVRDDMGKAV